MSRSGTRRTSILDRRAGQKAQFAFWARRVGLVAAVLILIGGFVTYAVVSGYLDQVGGRIERSFNHEMADKGFHVRNLLVEGRVNAGREELRALLDVEKGQSIFEPDLETLQSKLESLSWVKSATVERHLPDTIAVRLQEREPIALWQRNSKVSVIDAEGTILSNERLDKFKTLPLLVGDQAPEEAQKLIPIINADPNLRDRVESAKWIGGRRWDLYLKNGVSIKLPEDNIDIAFQRLAEAQKEAQLMDRKVESIDLRDPNRIIVQTEPGATEDYKAATQKQKNI